jgi:propanediol dehydratase small subunit
MKESLTVTAAVEGRLSLSDLRMDPAALAHQANEAGAHGNPQLAENLSRAAELIALSDEELLSLYEALRPNRSSREELEAIAADLDERPAPSCAALVREAARVYERRGLLS